MTVPGSPLRFLFDFISPNAYLAWKEIHGVAGRHDRQLEPVPVLFAGLLNANRAIGPAEIDNKWRWMVRDIVRKARRLGISLQPPRSHPFNPLLALRLACLEMSGAERRRLIDVLFSTIWAGGPGVTDPEVVAGVLDREGFAGAELVAAAGRDDVKQRLRRQTDEAVAAGVFGVPTVLVDDRLYWGFDDFPHLEAYLGGADELDAAELQAWEAVRPSSVRRREG